MSRVKVKGFPDRLVWVVLIACLVCACTATANLYVNEIMAANDGTVSDPQGDYDDWIEIYNNGPASVDIGGMSIADDTNGPPHDYRIPTGNPGLTTIPSGDFLILWADGDTNDGILHLPFQLSAGSGELVSLYDTNGSTVLDVLVFGPMGADVSYGRYPDGDPVPYLMSSPTPGASNSVGRSGAVTISEPSRTFSGSLSVTLSAATNSDAIYYTLDGSEPDTGSTLYTGAISVTETVQLRARSFVSSLALGPISSANYIRLAADMLAFSSDLPVVIADSFGTVPNYVSRIKGCVAFFEPGANGRTTVTNGASIIARADMEYRGNTSGEFKKQLRIEALQDSADVELAIAPLGMPAEADWLTIAANRWDKNLLRSAFVMEMSEQQGLANAEYRFVEMFIHDEATGDPISYADHYMGVYMFSETVQRGDDRIDVERLSPGDTNEPAVSGGYIFRRDRANTFTAGGLAWEYVYPDPATMASPEYSAQDAWIRAYLDRCYAALHAPDLDDPTNGYAAYLDVKSFIDYHFINWLGENGDAYIYSSYYYKPRGGKLFIGPAWDFDRAIESSLHFDDNPFNPCRPVGNVDFFGANFWVADLFEDINFFQAWVDRWEELREGVYSDTNIGAVINTLSNTVAEGAVRELERWPGLMDPRDAGQGGWYSGELDNTWAGEVRHMRAWLLARAGWIDDQLVGKPTFSQGGGQVSPGYNLQIDMPAHATTIYYTTDGSDPRAFGGGISPGAVPYAGEITIASNTIIMARAYNPTWANTFWRPGDTFTTTLPWSGPREAVFITDVPALAITEVMVNPRRADITETNGGYTASDYEFIEIRNTGAAPTPLVGVRFTDGIEFDFTWGWVGSLEPGEYALAVNNLAAFTHRYPGWAGMKIAGEYEGNLNDGGERVMLQGPLGETIAIFTYGDGRIWPQSADGAGHSLVPLVVDDQADGRLDYWGNWRASALIDGSPGTADAEPATSVVINEVCAHTDTGLDPPYDSDDWIELYNPLGTAVDVGGWYLSDNGDDLKHYRIPGGTVITAGGYLLLTENLDFHTNRLDGSGFGLDKAGEGIFLSHLPRTKVDRVVDAVRFKGQENGVSLGRYPDAGQYWYALSPTPGAPNAAPGPHVYISGIMYNPLRAGTNAANNTRDEYVKIRNPLGTSVELWTDAGAWRIDGGVSYTFPPGTTLAVGESLYLVSFDPADTEALSGFLAAYGLTNGQVRLYGPYDGVLANEGERIGLERPQAPDMPLDGVSWVIVDEVVYFAQAPWPVEPDGVGRAVVRVDDLGSGNDPGNWRTPEPSLLLALHWKLDETSGTVAGDSGRYGRGGTLRDILPGNADGNTPPLWAPGKTGNGLEFDGVDDVVRFDGGIVKGFPFTVTAWVKTSSGTGIRCAVYVGESAANYRYYCIGVNGGKGEIAGHVSDNPRARLSARGTTTVADGGWHHLAGVFRSPTEKLLYVDGLLEAVLMPELVYTGTVDRCSIGLCDRPSADGAWLGELDDVCVYNAELTEDGIHNLAEEVPETADEDGDGLPDAWERQYFGGTNAVNGGSLDDWDLDGLNNEGEYAAGTDPTNALSVFRVLIGTSNGLAVVWFATIPAAGEGYKGLERYYDLERRTNLLEGGWTGLVPYVDILGTGSPVVFTNDGNAVRASYRSKARLEPGL